MLAARLQEVAAAQVELTVELPADFFASPQVVCHAGAITAVCQQMLLTSCTKQITAPHAIRGGSKYSSHEAFTNRVT
jgi:hypothetical protein